MGGTVVMNLLWQGKPGKKVWTLGRRLDSGEHGDLPSQDIDHAWDDAGDHLGHITDCDHAAKIIVNGPDCTPLAERLVAFLNQDGSKP